MESQHILITDLPNIATAIAAITEFKVQLPQEFQTIYLRPTGNDNMVKAFWKNNDTWAEVSGIKIFERINASVDNATTDASTVFRSELKFSAFKKAFAKHIDTMISNYLWDDSPTISVVDLPLWIFGFSKGPMIESVLLSTNDYTIPREISFDSIQSVIREHGQRIVRRGRAASPKEIKSTLLQSLEVLNAYLTRLPLNYHYLFFGDDGHPITGFGANEGMVYAITKDNDLPSIELQDIEFDFMPTATPNIKPDIQHTQHFHILNQGTAGKNAELFKEIQKKNPELQSVPHSPSTYLEKNTFDSTSLIDYTRFANIQNVQFFERETMKSAFKQLNVSISDYQYMPATSDKRSGFDPIQFRQYPTAAMYLWQKMQTQSLSKKSVVTFFRYIALLDNQLEGKFESLTDPFLDEVVLDFPIERVWDTFGIDFGLAPSYEGLYGAFDYKIDIDYLWNWFDLHRDDLLLTLLGAAFKANEK